MTTPLGALPTPFAVLNEPVMRANITRMKEAVAARGSRLRPHVKTAKAVPIAHAMIDPAHGGITVSTLKEAEVMADAGITDILYGVGIAPQKLERVASLRKRGVDLTVMVDSLAAARGLAEAGTRLGMEFPVVLEVDTDGVRAGVPPMSEEARSIATALTEMPGTSYRGLLTHAGGSYGARGPGLKAAAEKERAGLADTARMLAGMGIPSPIVSVGSTPTALSARSLDGITEVRAGVFVFFDLMMAGVGVCGIGDVALSVLVTVIGHQPARGHVLTDGGWMALSSDRGTASHEVDQGYGLVCAEDGTVYTDLIVAHTSQEHGIIADRHGRPIDPARFPLATRLRILPNHACATASQFEAYAMTHDNRTFTEIMPRFNGW